MPYILIGICFLLGCFFTQSRISFFCILLAVVSFLINYTFFSSRGHPGDSGNIIIFLSVIYVPSIAALFYHSHERGMFTFHGYVRISIIISAILVIILLPGIPSLSEAVSSSESIMFRPVSEHIVIPGIGLLIFLLSAPVLLIRNRHESPFLGPLFFFAVLFVMFSLNFLSSMWDNDQQHTVFLAFMSGAALILAWAVMESSWRNAHIDELTDLPGRRMMKHHFARLGSAYSIAVLDVDHFKKVNDRHGHDIGDQVLRFISAFLKKNEAGKAYRFGGEEFVIVCDGDDYERTTSLLDELRKDIHAKKFSIRGKGRPRKKPDKPKAAAAKSGNIRVAVSIGVARRNSKLSTPQEVLDAADKALYQAKKAGRNRTKAAK